MPAAPINTVSPQKMNDCNAPIAAPKKPPAGAGDQPEQINLHLQVLSGGRYGSSGTVTCEPGAGHTAESSGDGR